MEKKLFKYLPFINIFQSLKPKKYTFLTQYLHISYIQNILRMQDFACNYSQTLVPRTRIGRIPRMAQTDLKVLSIFLIYLSKKNTFCSNTDTSNSRIQYMVLSIIKSQVLPCQTRTSQFNWQMYVMLNVLTARCDKSQITNR
jgi:hypothetical protein